MSELVKQENNRLPTEEELKRVIEYNFKPYEQETPPDKIKKRPDGYDYVEYSYMDKEYKKYHPFYSIRMVGTPQLYLQLLYVECSIELTSKITGNTECGTGGARIQLKTEAKKLVESGKRGVLPFDIIDYDKNVKSALTNAIKNAESRFGIAADVYQRREFAPSESQQAEFNKLLGELTISEKYTFRTQWGQTDGDYDKILNKMKKEVKKKGQNENKTDRINL